MASMASTSLPAYLLPGVPVCQPPHLEGDSSLATEILPGPPTVAAAQQSLAKRDPRKPSTVYSYLPASDPGTTYSGIMHGTWIGQESTSPRKRARVDKSSASGRAQRASARNQNGLNVVLEPPVGNEVTSGSLALPIAVESDITMLVDDDSPLSRSESSQNMLEGNSQVANSQVANMRGKRKDKGKGKEVDAPVRVKEEPRTISLHSPDPPSNLLSNNDHCSACRSQGALVYCDGCPRAFHLWCLDPPMESVDEGDSRWFCPACTPKHPPRKPPPGLLSPLIQMLESGIPTEYKLPEDIRGFFKDVISDTRGTYVDNSRIKQQRLNRHGQLEDRDAHRLRDRNGQPVLCFRCGTSALPDSVAAAAPAAKRARKSTTKATHHETWKNIVSCDYCNLHWHLDCLDPPLSTMPSFSQKWMCPNHSEQVIPPKRRIPKHATPIEVTKPSQYNNGNIEIVDPEVLRPLETQPKIATDEVLINGRRYRVPERIILLDFWNKINKGGIQESDSRLSSPLTSLSSLEDEDLNAPAAAAQPHSQQTELDLAQMLFDFKRGSSPRSFPNGVSRKPSDIQSDSQPASSQATPKVTKSIKITPAAKRAAAKSAAVMAPGVTMNGQSSRAAPTETISIASTSRSRKKPATNTAQPEPSTRELRSRSKAADAKLRRSGGDESETVSAPPFASTSKSKVRVKLEENDSNSLLLNNTYGILDTVLSAPSNAKATPKRRAGRKKTADLDPNGVVVKEEDEPTGTAPKRGKKRKAKDDEGPYIDHRERNERAREKREAKAKAAAAQAQKNVSSTAASSVSSLSTVLSAPGASTSAPTTPSLKIRLPRLNTIGSPVKSAATPTTTRS